MTVPMETCTASGGINTHMLLMLVHTINARFGKKRSTCTIQCTDYYNDQHRGSINYTVDQRHMYISR